MWHFIMYNAATIFMKKCRTDNFAKKGVTWHSYSVFMRSEVILKCSDILYSYLFVRQQNLYWNEQIINSSTQLWLVSVLNNTAYFITKHVTAMRKVMGCRLHD